ncbi:hypothetical protein IFM61606_03382 [Aspergillus udagawae]|nr:hypothetical protein IFM61606_03382 [Aspergillus udagawae]
MCVDFVLLVSRVIIEQMVRVIDQVDAINHRVDPAVLFESLRVRRVGALDVREIKLSLLGEDPSSSHLRHVLFELVDEEGFVFEETLQGPELVEPLRNTLVILVIFAGWAPLRIEHDDGGEAAIQPVKKLIREGSLDLILNAFPFASILQCGE